MVGRTTPAAVERRLTQIASGQRGGSDIAESVALYGDPELDRLIATATASNQTLRQAVGARRRGPRARSRRGQLSLPTISTNPSFTHLRTSGNRESTVTGRKVAQGRHGQRLADPVRSDLRARRLGRVRRSFESAPGQAAATADDAGWSG